MYIRELAKHFHHDRHVVYMHNTAGVHLACLIGLANAVA